jgi:Chaperone of endosialidase
MALPITVPYAFANATTTQNLSYLDADFNTITNAINGIGNGTVALSNVNITGGTINASFNATSISYGTSNVSITSSNGPVSINTAGNNAVYIDASQNVGIGVTNPTSPLEIQTGTDSRVRIENDGGSNITAISSINNAKNGYQPLIVNGSYLGFDIASSEKMRIDTSGNLLVGTFISNPGGATYNGQVAILSAGGTTKTGINIATTATTSKAIEFQYTAFGPVGSISTTTNATAYNTSSDYRLKENVVSITNGLAAIMSLKPVKYDWVSDKSKGEGFIAHELQAVIPAAVTGEKDAVDDDGKPIYQGVDYSKIVVHLVAALQEAVAKIDTLETRISTLETK